MLHTPPGSKLLVHRRWLLLIFLALIVTALAAYPSREALPVIPTQMTSTIAGGFSIPTTLTPEASSTVAPTRMVSDTRAQTDGLILGGVALVLIIIGGTLSAIRRKPLH
ncbi:MAG: hypothetical protein PHQ40_08595 [Anaerolineaceae bacterium]|nr:hypothetical protein [Anaerolineaceae bacterium]